MRKFLSHPANFDVHVLGENVFEIYFAELSIFFLTPQVFGRRQQGKIMGGSESQSQSSICSTPGQSSASNKISSDWPDPPDIPICSTEDEAASIYSDSGGFLWQITSRVTRISIFNEKTFSLVTQKKIIYFHSQTMWFHPVWI